MTRLIIKELLEDRYYLLAALLANVGLMLLGDPLYFRGVADVSGLTIIAPAMMVLMGLASYSRELSNETLPFLFARPIHWGWVYASKLLAGLVACIGIGVVTGIVYVATLPEVYRSVTATQSVMLGVIRLAAILAIVFIGGFLTSSVLCGTARAKGVFVGVMFAVGLLIDRLSNISENPSYLYVLLGAALTASILSVRAPLVLLHRERITLWLRIMAVGLLGTVAAAGILRAQGNAPIGKSAMTLYSPDRQFKAIRVRQGGPDQIFIEASGEKRTWIEGNIAPGLTVWTPDSQGLVYLILDRRGEAVRIARKQNGWKPETVCRLSAPAPEPNGTDLFWETKWSPSGNRLAVTAGGATRINTLIIIDMLKKRSMMTRNEKRIDSWWAGENRLATVTDSHRVQMILVP